MMYQSLFVAFLASTASAQHAHRHQHRGLRPSGSGTGSPYGYGNSTGIYSNATGSSTIASTTTDTDVVTVTVQPVSVSSGGSTLAANVAAVTTDSTCGASKSTTTVTSTEVVYVTVGASSSSSSAVVSSSVAAVVASSSSSSSVSDAAGAFYATSSSVASSTPVASTSSSAVAVSSSSSAATTVAASSTVATTSSSTSSSASSTATTSTSTGKRGLAYDDPSLTQAFAGASMSWAYNWASASSGDLLSGLEYVPMCWCPTKDSIDDWTSAAQSAIDSGSTYLLSFNEPDQTGQCDIDYATAASEHQTYMNQFSGSAKIGSPAVTNGGGSMGLTYLSNFFDSCDGKCDVDFLAIHWYNAYSDTAADDFKSHVNDAITLASSNGISEVWVTEFALTGASDSETASFLETILTWMDNESAVGRYAFFMCSDGLLISGDSVSDVIGAAYIA